MIASPHPSDAGHVLLIHQNSLPGCCRSSSQRHVSSSHPSMWWLGPSKSFRVNCSSLKTCQRTRRHQLPQRALLDVQRYEPTVSMLSCLCVILYVLLQHHHVVSYCSVMSCYLYASTAKTAVADLVAKQAYSCYDQSTKQCLQVLLLYVCTFNRYCPLSRSRQDMS